MRLILYIAKITVINIITEDTVKVLIKKIVHGHHSTIFRPQQ